MPGGRFAVAAIVVLALAAGCAPRRAPVADIGRDDRRLRFERELGARELLARGVEAQLTLRARVMDQRLPGAYARLLVGAPGSFRLRVESLFGTALDLSAAGDTVIAYIPSERMGWSTSSAGDSIGLSEPGRVACRLLSAGFRPPESAWDAPMGRDSLLELTWLEEGGEMRLAIGNDGLPRRAAFLSPGATLTARYQMWHHRPSGSWPMRITIEDSARGLEADCRLTAVRFSDRLAPERLVTPVPERAQVVSRASIIEWFEVLTSR